MIRRVIATSAALIAFALPVVVNAQASFDGAPAGETYSRTATRTEIHRGTITHYSGALREYKTEGGAQRHCPADAVVWLNTDTGIWHMAGERWYGRTKHGAYVCEKEAARAGDRETKNGQ